MFYTSTLWCPHFPCFFFIWGEVLRCSFLCYMLNWLQRSGWRLFCSSSPLPKKKEELFSLRNWGPGFSSYVTSTFQFSPSARVKILGRSYMGVATRSFFLIRNVPNPLENCWVLQHPCWILDSSTWLWSSSFSGNCKWCIMQPHFSVPEHGPCHIALDQAEIELCGHLILQFGPKICKILQKIVLRGTYVGYLTLLHAYGSVVFQGIKSEASSFLCTKTWPMLWNALEEAKIEPWGPLVFMLSFWGECHLKWCVKVQDSPGVVLNIHMSIAAFSGQYHVALGTSLDVVIWVQRKQLLGSIWFKES